MEITLKVKVKIKLKITVGFLVENYFRNDLDFRENYLNWGNI